MAKLKFTGVADGAITYHGKYEVTTGTILYNVNETDANALLQSGHFQVVEEAAKPAKDDSKKSSDTKDSKDSKGK